jgi:hypothetical protein
MKKLVILAAVIAFAAPVMAAVDLSVDSSGVLWLNSIDNANPPVGIGLNVAAVGGCADISAVTGNAFFNVHIDHLHDNPGDGIGDGNPAANANGAGNAALPSSVISLSMGELNAALNSDSLSLPYALATISVVGGDGQIVVTADALRGGVVGANAAAEGTTFSADNGTANTYDIGTGACAGCLCRGDISNDGINPGTSGDITFGDFNYFLTQFGAAAGNGFVIDPIPADLLCANVSDNGVTGVSTNTQINFGDFNYFLLIFGGYAGNGFTGPCLP